MTQRTIVPARLAQAAFCRGLLSALLLATAAARAGDAQERVEVSFPFFEPSRPEGSYTASLIKLMKQHPDLAVRQWGGINLPGSAGRSSLLMAIAGDTAPDFFYCWWHIIRNDIKNGFLYPLNEWIGEDLNGNGQIDDDEAKWEGWAKVPPLWRQVATEKGKVYGIPFAGIMYFALVYRKDLVQQAGLDPEKPPETWDEFYYWCQRLTYPNKEIPGSRLKRGQRGFALSPDQPWFWLPWMQAAGGSPIVQVRTSPSTGKACEFAMEETDFRARDSGEDLNAQPSTWKANFSSPPGAEACGFYHKLKWAPWIRDPETQEPLNLAADDLRNGTVKIGERVVSFKPDDVIRGVARVSGGQNEWQNNYFDRGEAAFMQWDIAAFEQAAKTAGIPPQLIGMCPVPAQDRRHKRVFQGHKHFFAMTEGVGRRSKRERDLVWECVKTVASEATYDAEVRRKVILGNAMWCRPDDLQRLGLHDYLAEVSPTVKRLYDEVAKGEVLVRTEPFAGFWQTAADALARGVLTLTVAESGERFDYAAALKAVDEEANSGGMFEMPRERLERHRPLARVIFAVCVCVIGVCVTLMIREKTRAKSGTSGMRGRGALPWLMMAPALLTILVWSYYPLLRGVVMAFQDYRVVGESRWVGLDNFIAAALDPNTRTYVWNTFRFVFLAMGLGFVAPIVLAFLVTEVPHGKVFFRTLFFLPQLSAGIVITLIWQMMYNETENGTLNRLLAVYNECFAGTRPVAWLTEHAAWLWNGLAGWFASAPEAGATPWWQLSEHFLVIGKQAWLQDPALAMLCCILPGVWAGAGMASLIYVAALKALPPDYYEAAALDGAGILGRIRHVTLPQLQPLIIINFVGAFIGAFQSMGGIFLLTFGGPGKETMVLELAIWKLAYNDLRFSMATTLAWFMGVGLIAFTYMQIRFLRRVDFRRAEEN